MSTENTRDPKGAAIPPLLSTANYALIYLCEHPEGPVGWTRTAEESVEWAMRVRDPGFVKITKLYEIKHQSGQ